MSKVIHYINSTNWLKNSTFSETASAGTNYTSFLGNGSGSRLVTSIPIWLYDDTFTITLAPNFNFAGLYFDKDKKYLGRSTGYVEWASTTPRELTKPSNAVYMLMYLRRASGSLLPEDVAEANLTITYSNLDSSRVFASDGISLSDTKTLEETVSSHSTSISNNATAIALKANSSDVYTKTETDGLISTEVSNRNSAIEQSASQIQLSVSQTYTTKTEFDELEIGGRNLARGTSFDSDSDLAYWFKNQNPILSIESGSLKIIANQTSSTPGMYTNISVEEGKYTVSFWYKAITENGMKLQGVSFATSSRNAVIAHNCSIVISDTEWHYYEHTFKPTATQAGNVSTLAIFLAPSGYASTDGIYIQHLKLEKGNRATDWTPAPEDYTEYTDSQVEAAKAAIKITTDGISTEVAKKVNGSEIISSINQSAEEIKIQASKVNIDGTAIFTNSDFQTQLNNQGYATTTQVVTAKSEAISAAASDATSKANAAQSAAISTAAADATSKANAAEANAIAAIPTDISEFNNDAGYATTTQAQGYASTVNNALESYKSTTNTTLTSLQNQVDGQIEAWYKSVDPTGLNEPASTWTTDALKARHMGDLYYNVTNGHSWRWMQSGNTYEWQQIPDSDAAAALAAAQNAQTTANSKRRIFTTTPTVPYDIGDLWVDGSSVKYCSNMKTDSGTYSENDWTTTATDDTGVSALQQQLTAQLGTTEVPYTQVEWVESNGRQFIYLDWKPDIATYGFEADFIIRNAFTTTASAWNAETNVNGFGNVFGTRNASGVNDIQLGSYGTNGVVRIGNSSGQETAATFKKDQSRQQISLRGTTLTHSDGTTKTVTRLNTNTAKTYTNMTVFGLSGATRNLNGTFGVSQPGTVRIYSLKFYDSDVLAVDLVPAIRNTDSMPGLYDKIRNHFYPAFGATYGNLIENTLGETKTVWQSLKAEIPTLTQADAPGTRRIRQARPMWNDLIDGQQFNLILMHTPITSIEAEKLAGWEKSTTTYVHVYLKIYLANNKETEWIPVFYNPTTRLTDQYKGGVSIPLTYRENFWAGATTAANGTAIARGLMAGINYNTEGSNTYDRRLHNNAVLAKTAITASHLIGSDGTGYYNLAAGIDFNPSYPILYASAAIKVNATGATTYEAIPSVTFTNTGTIENGAANKMLYLRCLPGNNGMLTVSSTPVDSEDPPHSLYLTTTPTPSDTNDNLYIYIPLGVMVNATQGYFATSKDLYAFINNEFIQINPSTIIATQKLYYRTNSLTTPTAPTTWITTNNPATYDAWNLAVPPLAASTAANATKYPYLYSVEQHKRVDGTIVTGEVSNDSNTTIIDGGSIITNSVTATQIAAGTITAAEIEAGTITATQIASSAITTDKLDANAVTAAKIASSAITTDKLDANAVTTAKLDAGAVTAAKIDSGAITTDKLDAEAVTAAKIASGAITTDKLDAGAVTATKIDATDLHVRAVNIDGTIGFGQLSGVQASGNYALSSDIPQDISDLTNDVGFITSEDVPTTVAELTDSSNYALASNLTTEINQRKAQYGTCSTAAGTASKAVTCADFELVAGNEITVKFSTANTSSGKIQLNVNSKGNKDVWVGNAVTSATNMLLWGANAYITFKYDGTQFQVIGEPRTWYGECSVAEATAAKTSTITGCVICKGTKVELAMTYANSAASPTLNISSTGAKNLYFGTGTTRPTIASGTSWLAANTATFTFDGATWRTQGKTYIDANSITTGYISADRIQSGSLSIGIFNNSAQADILNSNVTVPQKVSDLTNDTGFITSSSLPTKVSDLDNDSYFATQTEAQGYATTAANGKDSAIAAAARRTDVAIAVTAIDYDAGTATLQATLYIDGEITTNNITSYQWLKDGTEISGATFITLSVTAAMGLDHIYSCTIDYT